MMCIMLYMLMYHALYSRPVTVTNPSSRTQCERNRANGNENDFKMDSNPAYGDVEYTADEGED